MANPPAFRSIHGKDFGLTPRGLEVYGRAVTGGTDFGGTTYYVDNGVGEDDGDGLSPARPFKTWEFCVANRVTANQNDTIILLAGHTENLTAADAVDLDKAGVTTIGVGYGTDRPTFTYTNTAGEVTFGANNNTIMNIVFNASEPDVLKGINIEAAVDYVSIINCEFGVDTAGTDEFAAAIDFENGSKGSLIANCLIDQALGNAVAGIRLSADTDQLTIRDNVIRGDYSTANITGLVTLSTDILIQNNLLLNGESGNLNAQPCIQLLTNTTGMLIGNDCFCNVVTNADAIVADLCMYSGNKYSETVGAASFDLPLRPEHLVQVAIRNTVVDDATDVLFDINGGNVIVFSIYATCEVDGTGSPVISLLENVDTGTDEVIATGINLAAVNVADTVTVTNGALAVNAAGADTGIMNPIILRPGTIDMVLDSGTPGALVLKWHIIWAPIDVGATITDLP